MSEPFDTRDDDLLVTEEGETLSDFDGSPERSTPEHDPLLAAVAVPEGAEPGDEVTEQHVASHVDDVDVDSEMRVVDEDAYADDDEQDDEEDYGHLARLFDEEEETPDAAASTALETASDPEIPLDLIDPEALWVVKRLRAKGYEAYLTGGCVRDLLLGIAPKDFDVATAAHPNQVKAVFRNCRLIGRRFRLAHVYFPDGKVIETATFRANPLDEMEDLPEDLLVERDNVFGTVEDDARRRALTINGLFYDPIAGRV
ncbi:MAG: poly(A) polymerase, partial [Myxococcota bacterium]